MRSVFNCNSNFNSNIKLHILDIAVNNIIYITYIVLYNFNHTILDENGLDTSRNKKIQNKQTKSNNDNQLYWSHDKVNMNTHDTYCSQ